MLGGNHRRRGRRGRRLRRRSRTLRGLGPLGGKRHSFGRCSNLRTKTGSLLTIVDLDVEATPVLQELRVDDVYMGCG